MVASAQVLQAMRPSRPGAKSGVRLRATGGPSRAEPSACHAPLGSDVGCGSGILSPQFSKVGIFAGVKHPNVGHLRRPVMHRAQVWTFSARSSISPAAEREREREQAKAQTFGP